MIPELKCSQCHLKWLPRTTTGKPVRCPRCGKPYTGPVLIGALLPCEVHEFLDKIGLADYNELMKDRILAELEAWQLAEVEKGENADKTLFEESCEAFKALGHPERVIKRIKRGCSI